MKPKGSYIIVLYVFISFHLYAQPGKVKNSVSQQFCSLGDFILESGEKIYDCKIGYRTYGKPNAAKSNIILFLTWFTGTSTTLEQVIPGKVTDTSEYYLVIADALGNGVSTSPSNSSKQHRLRFPKFSIRDMIESQYQLLFAEKIIPIVSSPQNTSYDLLLWRGLLQALQRDTAYHNGDYTGIPPMHDQSVMWNLVVSTPEKVNAVPRKDFKNWFMQIQTPSGFDWNDMHRQMEAIIGHDIAKAVDGSLEQVANTIKAKMLIILAKEDHVVNATPSIQLAGMMNAKLAMLESNCGHLSFECETERITKEIRKFLSEK